MEPVISSLITPLIAGALNTNLQEILDEELAEKNRQARRRQEFIAYWGRIDALVTEEKKEEIERSLLSAVQEWLLDEGVLPAGQEKRGTTLLSIERNDDDNDRYQIEQFHLEIQTKWEVKHIYFSVESYGINEDGELEWELNIPGSLEPSYDY